MVVSEAHPFAKTGGLAEVAAALPAALARLGHTVTLVLPRYRGITPDSPIAREADLTLGFHDVRVGFVEQEVGQGVQVVFVDAPALFDRAGLYGEGGRDYPDNAVRFAVLARAALEYARLTGDRYDVIHAHDWQAGLVPVYQKMLLSSDPVVGGVPVVFTIHNLAFQGIFGRDILPAIGLGWEVFHHEALEFWGNVSLLKGGVNFSERLTTVSPTYAKEILTPEFGFGFEGVMAGRAGDLTGILNGIDTARWNPAADPFVPVAFTASDLAAKRQAKRVLLQESGLPTDEAALDRPLIGLISRLTDQKGLDLIGTSATDLLALDASWVLLGSGERHYEDLWRALASRHPGRVATTIGFDERLAHLIEAGADMFLMPSRFEPCGLNQMYSLRYGTVPIVRATGGLQDTVTDAAEPGGNGIKFAEYTRTALVGAVRRALELYEERSRWTALQQAGMGVDPSWDVSAREYVKVYRGQR
ncbi:glycogen synthase GlgA [soil metagenome]